MKKFQSKSTVLSVLLVVLTGFTLYGYGSERKSITSPQGANEALD
jgi:hypothetical protein